MIWDALAIMNKAANEFQTDIGSDKYKIETHDKMPVY